MELVQAVREGRLGEIVALLASGADVSAKDADGNVALIKAVFFEHARIAEYLSNAPGVDVNATNARGVTALISAVFYGDESICC